MFIAYFPQSKRLYILPRSIFPPEITGYAGSLQAKGIGNVVLQCTLRDKKIKLDLRAVLHVPDAPMNLLSFSQLHGLHSNQLAPEGFSVGSSGILAHIRRNNLYTLSMWKEDGLNLVATTIDDTLDVWHARLGHLGEQNIKRLVNISLGIDLTKPLYKKNSCQECSIMQGRSKPHLSHISPGAYPNDLVHRDLVGPLHLPAGGAKYFITFLDDYTE